MSPSTSARSATTPSEADEATTSNENRRASDCLAGLLVVADEPNDDRLNPLRLERIQLASRWLGLRDCRPSGSPGARRYGLANGTRIEGARPGVPRGGVLAFLPVVESKIDSLGVAENAEPLPAT